MKSVPDTVRAYKRTREFDENSVPAGLLRAHTTASGVWGRIVVLEGTLRYRILSPEAEELILLPGRDGVVEPEVPHEVSPEGRVRFYVEFLRAAE